MNQKQAKYVQTILDMYAAGQENAYEAFLNAGYELDDEGEEDDLQFVKRCAEQDFDDGPYQGAVYQEIYDKL